MEPLLAVTAVAVVVVSCGRFVLSGLHDGAHPRDVAGWHAVMGAVMALMLLGSLRGAAAWATGIAFAVGLIWSLIRLQAVGGASYGRLVVGSLAMVVMTIPLLGGTATATPRSMPGMVMPGASGNNGAFVIPPILAVGLLVAVIAAAGLDLVRLRTESGSVARAAGGCDLLMALAMGYMLAMLL